MNLHIAPDNVFVNAFYDNLKALNLLEDNKIIIRTNKKKLSAIQRDLPFADVYSAEFDRHVGDTTRYRKVFIHYFTPILFRWVARHQFNELSWMVWGGDLYNLRALDRFCYAPLTLAYVQNTFSLEKLLYDVKVWLLHAPYRKRAYAKVKHILTWMKHEYEFALNNLPVRAGYKFFFYENQSPYHALDSLRPTPAAAGRLSLIVGNSGSPANNHLDAVRFLEEQNVKADLLIPVSYGDKPYIAFLKKNLAYRHGKIEFVDRYMKFEEYVEFLAGAHGLVMNTIRPQGFGNILMMMYMRKPVFFNEGNISLPDLTAYGINWRPMQHLASFAGEELPDTGKKAVADLFSHERLIATYRQLFHNGNT